ncbi:GspH/FimT family pseudopilin [Acidihalobacter ferrooxydans]|uniref:Type II secretion system protein H n=1 Tax=Acidihalobacter ferrooxydans TaxID=1765967 RepID=A0A1P8UFH6_9GAMM|nr:GspH/FimT family pseudopilin [Acidihalobacter ferrooxydans]APZ42597.1 hypothetical protein BW247_05375 [Acidihalobacter ferrooxydans]
MKKPPDCENGFTLINLLVVLTVVGVLAGVGIPSYRNVIAQNRMASEINAFTGALQLARVEAVEQDVPASLCAVAANSSTLTCSSPGTTDWTHGWIVYSGSSPATGHVLRVHAALQGGDRLVSSTGGRIGFNREGFAHAMRVVLTHATVRQCVSINDIGRVREASCS